MLKISNLKKVFAKGTVNEKTVLDGLDFQLQQGDFVTLIGGNGAGKSTLFNLISGTYFADDGKIQLDGKDITFLPEYKRASCIGHLFQDPLKGTAPTMTLEENLALAYGRGTKRGLGIGITKKDSTYFKEILSSLDLGLEDRLKTRMGLLSGGQRQAVTLLMATIVTPKLLLLDEHTAALDPATADKVIHLTKEIVQKNNITTMMITHNIGAALKLGNRTVMMDKGEIILDLDKQQRSKMTVNDVLSLFHEKSHKELDNDRILFS